MKRINYIFKSCLLFVFVYTGNVFSQIEPNFSLYRFNALAINPAQAGAQNYLDVSALNRWQWVGIDGAPKTFSMSCNTPFKERYGAGLVFINDANGPVSNTKIGINGAVNFSITQKLRISFGLLGSMENMTVDLSRLTTINKNDAQFAQNMTTGNKFNGGWGFLLYSKKGYFGFSQPNIVKNDFMNKNNTNVHRVNHYFMYAGYNYDFNDNLQFRPSTLLRLANDAPFSMDINAVVSYKRTFDVGFTYHHRDALGLILGYTITRNFYVGYAYDIPFSAIVNGTKQTHELALRYKFLNAYKSVSNPRYFN